MVDQSSATGDSLGFDQCSETNNNSTYRVPCNNRTSPLEVNRSF